jgi:hypothetical protein
VRTGGGALAPSRLRGRGNWGLLLLDWWSLRLLSMRLHRWGGVVLRVLLVLLLRRRLLLVRVLWLRRLRWLCGVPSIVHRLVTPAHVRLRWLLWLRLLLLRLLLLLSGVRGLTVPSGMVSKGARWRLCLLRLRLLLLLLLVLLQLLLLLQGGHRCRLHRTP